MARLEYKTELRWNRNIGNSVRVREFGFSIDMETDDNNANLNSTEYLPAAMG